MALWPGRALPAHKHKEGQQRGGFNIPLSEAARALRAVLAARIVTKSNIIIVLRTFFLFSRAEFFFEGGI